MLAVREVTQVVVVAPAPFVGEVAATYAGEPRVAVVPGGAERADSVRGGLAALGPEADVVLVHDAARCLTPTAVFERVIDAVRGGRDGAVPGVPVSDTIKVVDARGVVTATPDRAGLRAAQTPQGFPRAVLEAAHAAATGAVTDDSALVEALGHDVVVVDGDPLAFKITTRADLDHAARLLRS